MVSAARHRPRSCRKGRAPSGRRPAGSPGRRKRLLRSALFLAALLFALPQARSQDVRATARVDSHSVNIGDWIRLHLEVRHPSGVPVALPALADSLDGMEVIRRDTPGVRQEGGMTIESVTFTLVSFDSGMHVIPPLAVRYGSPAAAAGGAAGGATAPAAGKSVETAPVAIFVHGIAVDTSKEIRDIKDPLTVPLTFADLLPYIIAAVLVGGLVWLVLFIRKKRRLGESLLPEAPRRPAHEIALEALRSLESEKLWQRGKVKEYHSSLTDIVRTYIERRFGVMAMEMTSEEILGSDAVGFLAKDEREKLKDMLIRADLVKFAKYAPVADEHEASFADAQGFVESTRGDRQAEQSAASSSPGSGDGSRRGADARRPGEAGS